MSWFTDANCQAAAELEHAQKCYAVDFNFPSGHVRLHTALGDLVLDGNTYIGVGTLGTVESIPERAQLTSEKWTYSLSLTDLTIIPESEIDNCYGRSVTEYEVYFNPDTFAVIGKEINREGRMGRVRRTDGKSPVILVSCENRLAILEKANGLRYTDEHQQNLFSGDLGCDQVKFLETTEVLWGGYRVDPGVPGGYFRNPGWRGPPSTG